MTPNTINTSCTMITGEIKSKIDLIWEDFWTGGITNSISVLEQMTYLFFMKMLDDAQRKAESNANLLGTTLVNPTFPVGQSWHNPETEQDIPYERLRWHVFKNDDGASMFQNIRMNVFPFIKTIGEGRVWLGTKGVEIGIVDQLGNLDDAVAKAVELAGLESYKLSYYPEKKDPYEELLKMLDNTTEEEKLVMKVRSFCSKPRIMALMPEVKIQ